MKVSHVCQSYILFTISYLHIFSAPQYKAGIRKQNRLKHDICIREHDIAYLLRYLKSESLNLQLQAPIVTLNNELENSVIACGRGAKLWTLKK